MLELIFGALFIGTSAGLVKKYRPNAFRGSDGRALATDLALTLAGAVTIAPVVCVCQVAKHLAKAGRFFPSNRR